MKIGVLRFPGTNCDRDMWQAIVSSGGEPQWLWHADHFEWKSFAALIIPGGFSYGDYLRTGVLAALTPVLESTREAAAKGVPVFGICNGFQILCEAQLLPGVLLRNEKLKFQDRWVELNFKTVKKPWQTTLKNLRMPIAHGEGRYYAEPDALKELQDHNQIWCTYSENPNGSLENIAGISNRQGNVVAMMPHPERAMSDWMGSSDGRQIFQWVGA